MKTKRALFHTVIVCMGVVLLTGLYSPNENANKLFVEASQLAKSAQEAEKTSYVEALKFYRHALAKLESIISEYPSSRLAVEIIQDKNKIGPYGITEFKETIIPLAWAKARFEEDPITCVPFVAQAMIEKHAYLKDVFFRSMAEKYVKAGQYDRAFQIAQKIDAGGHKHSILLDIADECVQGGQMDKAFEVLSCAALHAQADQYDSDRVGSLVYIARIYVEAGRPDKASEILSHALQTAQTMSRKEDPCDKACTIKDIAIGYAKSGQHDKALQVVETIEISHVKDRALRDITGEYAAAGQYDTAFQIARTIEDDNNKVWALRDIAYAYKKAGRRDKASEMLSYALQAAQSVEISHVKDRALRDIAGEYAEVGQYDTAFQVARAIEDANNRAWALRDIAHAHMKAGRRDKASEILPHALQAAQSIEIANYSAYELRNIASMYAEVGQCHKAIQVAETIADPDIRASSWLYIAYQFAKAGQHDRALRLAGTMEDDQSKAWALWKIAVACMETGQDRKASEILSRAVQTSLSVPGEPDDKIEVLRRVADEYMKLGQKDKASEVLSCAVQVAGTIPQTRPRAKTLADIGIIYSMLGQKDKASEVLSCAVQITHSEGDDRDRADITEWLADTAVECAESGLRDNAIEILFQALQTAKKIENADYKAYMLEDIAEAAAQMSVEYVEPGQSLKPETRRIAAIFMLQFIEEYDVALMDIVNSAPGSEEPYWVSHDEPSQGAGPLHQDPGSQKLDGSQRD